MTYHIKDIKTTIKASQQAGRGTLSIERQFYCDPYNQIVTLMFDMLGGYKLFSNFLLYVQPMSHPLFPWARCTDLSIEPKEVMGYVPAASVAGPFGLTKRIPVPLDNGLPGAVGEAIVTATYNLPTLTEAQNSSSGGNADQQMDIASEQWDFGGQRLTQLNEFYKWIVNGIPKRQKDFQVTKNLSETRTQLTRHRVLRIPIGTISGLQDTINLHPFRMVNTIIPAECVRFDGASASRRLTSAQGLQFYELTYKFALRLIYDYIETGSTRTYVGWNRIYNPEKGYWERMLNTPTFSIPGTIHSSYPPNSRGIYWYDEDIFAAATGTGGSSIRGLMYLFDPRAT
jgi:hypothetical protein